MSENGEFKGRGYCDKSMSVNAFIAYENDQKPLSKWNKKDILYVLKKNNVDDEFIQAVENINLPVLKEYLLQEAGYHHTGMRYQRTFFYCVMDIESSEKANQLLKQMEQAQLNQKANAAKRRAAKKQEEINKKFVRVEIKYTITTANGRYKKIISGEGVVCGNWCYLKDRTKKKVSGKHFNIIREIEEMPSDFSLEDYYDDKYEYESTWQ